MSWLDNLRNWAAQRMAVGGPTIDSGINAYLSDVGNYLSGGGRASVYQTAAVEFAAGILGRAFMAAQVQPAMPALDPGTLAMLARQTILAGNAVFLVDLNRRTGEPRLIPAIVEDSPIGGAAPDTWVYTLKMPRPNGANPIDIDQLPTRAVPYAGVIHVRYMPSPSAPWHGISPLVSAGFTAETLAAIEKSLRDDSTVPTGGIMPQPDGASPTAVKQIQSALTSGKGALTPIETTASGFGLGPNSAPRRDWEQTRFGPMPPSANIVLWESAMQAVMSAMAINPSLYTSQGAALRESYRHLFSGTIIPLGRLIEAELSEKLEQNITITFPERVASDISALSRGFSSLVTAGYTPEQVAGMLGFSVSPPPQPEPAPDADDDDDAGPPPPIPATSNGRYHQPSVLF